MLMTPRHGPNDSRNPPNFLAIEKLSLQNVPVTKSLASSGENRVVDNRRISRLPAPERKSSVRIVFEKTRVTIGTTLSILDLLTDVIVILIWLLRKNYIGLAVVGILIMIVMGFFAYRAGPAGCCYKILYALQIGACFECQKVWADMDGRATFAFRMLRYLEITLRALPFGALQIFVQVFHSSYLITDGPFGTNDVFSLLLNISILVSCLSFGFWMTNYYKDRMRDKYCPFNPEFELGWNNRVMFWITTSLDFYIRIFSIAYAFRYGMDKFGPWHIPLVIIVVGAEEFTYYGCLALQSDNFRRQIRSARFRLLRHSLGAIVSVAPIVVDTINRSADFIPKFFALSIEIVMRMIQLTAFVVVLQLFGGHKANLDQTNSMLFYTVAGLYVAGMTHLIVTLFVVERKHFQSKELADLNTHSQSNQPHSQRTITDTELTAGQSKIASSSSGSGKPATVPRQPTISDETITQSNENRISGVTTTTTGTITPMTTLTAESRVSHTAPLPHKMGHIQTESAIIVIPEKHEQDLNIDRGDFDVDTHHKLSM